MVESTCPPPIITEEDFNFAMGVTNESPLEKRLKAAQEDFNRKFRQLRQADGQYYANDGPDADRVFHFFPKLPAELQLAVWKEAANSLPVPKLQAFDFDLAYDPNAAPQGRAGNGLVACFKPKRTRELRGHVGLLMACLDSRKAFLDAGDYHMLPLTYLVGPPVEDLTNGKKNQEGSFEDHGKKTNTWFDKKYGATPTTTKEANKTVPLVEEAAPKSPKNSQVNKTFGNVLLPVNFEDTRFHIDRVAVPFAYKSVHPTPPSSTRAFTQAAGLEFMHHIKKLVFSMDRKSWNKSIVFSHWFATKPDHHPHRGRAAPFSLGALEELSYVSTRAADRQCCIGADEIWDSVHIIEVREFDRQQMMSEWQVSDLYRVHRILMCWLKEFNRDFNTRWGQALRQKCTCRR